MASALREHPAIDNGGLATFHHLFETALPKSPGRTQFAAMATVDTDLWSRLAELLDVTEEELPTRLKEIGQELAFHLAANPALYEQFAQSLSQKKRKPKRGKAAAEFAATAAKGDIAAVRTGLLAKSASKALKEKLS